MNRSMVSGNAPRIRCARAAAPLCFRLRVFACKTSSLWCQGQLHVGLCHVEILGKRHCSAREQLDRACCGAATEDRPARPFADQCTGRFHAVSWTCLAIAYPAMRHKLPWPPLQSLGIRPHCLQKLFIKCRQCHMAAISSDGDWSCTFLSFVPPGSPKA